MKFNMGCGHKRAAGYINVDAAPECEPDELWDLEQTPWPWPDGCAEEVRFIHSLEHLGAAPKVFLAIMQELYRIAAPGCRVVIHVPHPRHDDFLNDPTHVRAISPTLMRLFDRELNDRVKREGGANSPLAHYTGVDFQLVESSTILAEPYLTRWKSGAVSTQELDQLVRERNNIAKAFHLTLVARKSQ